MLALEWPLIVWKGMSKVGAGIIPGRFCEKCGEPLWAVQMDVLSVEVICMNCDNHASCTDEDYKD